jgi:hypothetical protein
MHPLKVVVQRLRLAQTLDHRKKIISASASERSVEQIASRRIVLVAKLAAGTGSSMRTL